MSTRFIERKTRVHLVKPLWDPHGGSEHRTLDTWRLLSPHCDARMWTEYEPARQFSDEVPVVFIDGRKAFKYRLDEQEFLKKLAS